MPRLFPRSLVYGLIGAALAIGAPLGLLAVRLAAAPGHPLHSVHQELEQDRVTYLYVTLSTAAVFASFGVVLGRQADALVRLSRTDALTGLGNPLAFVDRLQQEVSHSHRYGEPLSLLLVDVDGLKSINDQGGHGAGNRALQAVARALRTGARAADLPARVGGDEFALLTPGTPLPAAAALAERIRALVAREAPDGPTVSVGVATLDTARGDGADLRDRADAALYEAKRKGRDRVEVA